MRLVEAIKASEGRPVRRTAWMSGARVEPHTGHWVARPVVVLCDTRSKDPEPYGWSGHLTIVRDDSLGRVYQKVDFGGGASRPEHPVVAFKAPYFPTYEDLVADDWAVCA